MDIIKQYDLKTRTQIQQLKTSNNLLDKSNNDLKAQLTRSESRMDQITQDTLSNFSKKDEVIQYCT